MYLKRGNEENVALSSDLAIALDRHFQLAIQNEYELGELVKMISVLVLSLVYSGSEYALRTEISMLYYHIASSLGIIAFFVSVFISFIWQM